MKSVGEKLRTIFFHFFFCRENGFPEKTLTILAHYMEALVTITKVQDQLRNRATQAVRRTDLTCDDQKLRSATPGLSFVKYRR